MTKATVVIPTSIDRGPLLELAVASVQRQTEPDWELMIIGDGVAEATRETAQALAAADGRISFHDFPKHPRRGEDYRHERLAAAQGEFVCYLCDRDLMLPNHLTVLAGLLSEVDFGHTLIVAMSPAQEILFYESSLDIANAHHRAALLAGRCGIPLSFGAHRLDAYRRLPHGWRTTPEGIPTDRYMWEQFLREPDISAGTRMVPTVVYLRRGAHPGLSTEARLAETRRYFDRYCRAGGDEDYREEMLRQLVNAAHEKHMKKRQRPTLLRRVDNRLRRLRGEWRPIDRTGAGDKP